ncbi:MAG: methylaspartate ammonia-lyase [Kiritimatiellae bacterium]|nr:methylaspartate ammonia-lyase [Kiritimatiellia bacterium]
MKIKRALFAAGKSAFFFDDQRAIKEGAQRDGFAYRGRPVTRGFDAIRVAGESISVMLVLENERIALGDCAAVQYSGAGGRAPLLLARRGLPFLERNIRPLLEGRKIEKFRTMAEEICAFRHKGRPLHTALLYGLTQALLDASAKAENKLKCEIICGEYRLPIIAERVPIFAQSGDNRYENADKMILKRVDVLPHGLINNIEEKLGRDGGKLKEYIRWIAKRVRQLRPDPSYRPVIHIDVYGTIGSLYDGNLSKTADYLAGLEKDAGGFALYIEGPVDMDEKQKQMEALRVIKRRLAAKGAPVKIVADEWCNTLEDIRDFCAAEAGHMLQIKTPDLGGIQNTVASVLYCKSHGMEAYQGGTCNETEISSRVCVHLACASRPERMLAKPGMGFDEGFMIVNNEMERIARILKWRQKNK